MNQTIDHFRKNVESVYDLVDFDRYVLDFALAQVSSLKSAQAITRLQTNAIENAERALQNVKTNNSLRPKYKVIFNQCIVLLVSYFGSAVSDIFKDYLTECLRQGRLLPGCKKEEIKLSFDELQAINYNVLENIGDIVVSTKNISFQDMQSIARAFRDWLGYEPPQGRNVNNIIVGQACRHVIVHSGGIVDRRLMNQIRSATPRDIKQGIALDENIQFEPSEIVVAGNSMIEYTEQLVAGLASAHVETASKSD